MDMKKAAYFLAGLVMLVILVALLYPSRLERRITDERYQCYVMADGRQYSTYGVYDDGETITFLDRNTKAKHVRPSPASSDHTGYSCTQYP